MPLPQPHPQFTHLRSNVVSGTTIPVCFTFTLYFLIRNFKVLIHLHIWIGHILCRNCLLKHIIEGMTEVRTDVVGRRRRRCKQLLDDLTETRGYWKLKEEAPDHILWRTSFGRDCHKTPYRVFE